jgi:hypothetical protein
MGDVYRFFETRSRTKSFLTRHISALLYTSMDQGDLPLQAVLRKPLPNAGVEKSRLVPLTLAGAHGHQKLMYCLQNYSRASKKRPLEALRQDLFNVSP